MQGKIVKGIAGFYYIHVVESGVYECKAKGIFRKEKIKPLVGDNVKIEIIDENEKKRLLEDVMENPYDLFYYGKYLVKEYPEQVYKLCYMEIRERCAQAKDRREYKKVTKQIAQLIKWKGNDTAKSLIEELKQTYSRRPALLDELEKVEKKL